MERLRTWSYQNINRIGTGFKRYLQDIIKWDNRLIILVGARGVGKTTLMLQHIKENLPLNEEVIYVSLDDIFFAKNSLIEFAEEFAKRGGKHLFLDEVQKYKDWAREVKAIYDNYPDIKLVLSGSSAIELLQSEGDLSRRALYYTLNGLSFREYLNYQYDHNLVPYSLNALVENHLQLSLEISGILKPIKAFEEYTKLGYYPYYKEDIDNYHRRLAQTINTVLEVDIPSVFSVDGGAVYKMKKLIALIAEMVPFKPNIKKLSQQVGISRDSLIRYLKYLEKANIIHLLYSTTKGISLLNKPEKIYLNNPNIGFALSSSSNTGSLRETFFINQLSLDHEVKFSGVGDFIVDDQFTFEIGGANKSKKQLEGIENGWVVADNMEISVGNKIPLWLFGFVY